MTRKPASEGQSKKEISQSEPGERCFARSNLASQRHHAEISRFFEASNWIKSGRKVEGLSEVPRCLPATTPISRPRPKSAQIIGWFEMPRSRPTQLNAMA